MNLPLTRNKTMNTVTGHVKTRPREIRFFDPRRELNQCIVRVDNLNTDELDDLFEIQKTLNRTGIEFL